MTYNETTTHLPSVELIGEPVHGIARPGEEDAYYVAQLARLKESGKKVVAAVNLQGRITESEVTAVAIPQPEDKLGRIHVEQVMDRTFGRIVETQPRDAKRIEGMLITTLAEVNMIPAPDGDHGEILVDLNPESDQRSEIERVIEDTNTFNLRKMPGVSFQLVSPELTPLEQPLAAAA